MTRELLHQKINALKVCVLIPTYNNERTLKRIIDGVLKQTANVIVINDGATDSTAQILKEYPDLVQIEIPTNKGKGNALREGFKKASLLNYEYAITIDSDGQHFPEDIPSFIEALEQSENKNLLLIGARNMSHESVPGKSSFGNKFSNFWFWFETGIKLTDTQSGFRLYPLLALNKLKLYTNKFEFEIETIVKSAWAGVAVKNIPIQVLYDESERVTHFRPFKDFTRISILNTYFVLIAILYIKPRDAFRRLKKKGVKQFLNEEVLGSLDSPEKKSLSVALGVFVGMSPFWGFHTLIVIFLAIFFKLNKTIAFVFSNVSLPPFIPFIVYGGLKTGEFILGEKLNFQLSDISANFQVLKHLKTYIVGSFTLAILAAIILGFASYCLFLFSKPKKNYVRK